MPILINKNALTFDDILLVPQYSEVASRKDVDLGTELFGVTFNMPICSANMDTVTGPEMATIMEKLGGFGVHHRYCQPSEILSWILSAKKQGMRVIVPSIGIKPEEYQIALDYVAAGATAICVDIAHGDSKHMIEMVAKLAQAGVKVIAGNVATYDAALGLAIAGADAIKVGVGPGSMCTTRIVTGHGVPQLTAIEECVRVKQSIPAVKIIADGGIRTSGDCVKALAFGADMVMIGSLLSGTNETPGDVITQSVGGMFRKVKEYRGMASSAARSSVTQVDKSYTPEGEATLVPCKGPAEDVILQLVGGIRSGLSYSGATNLAELRENAQYVIVTNNGVIESRPHGVK